MNVIEIKNSFIFSVFQRLPVESYVLNYTDVWTEIILIQKLLKERTIS